MTIGGRFKCFEHAIGKEDMIPSREGLCLDFAEQFFLINLFLLVFCDLVGGRIDAVGMTNERCMCIVDLRIDLVVVDV